MDFGNVQCNGAKQRTLIIIGATLLVAGTLVCAWFLLSAYREVRDRTVEQRYTELQVHAGLAKNGIEQFFAHIGENLAYMARDPDIIRLSDRGKVIARQFHATHNDEIANITLVDDQGRITYSYPEEPSIIGTDISGQEHVKRVLTTRRPVISDIFLAIQGERSVALYVPIVRDGRRAGAIGVRFPFNTLARKFLDGLRLGKHGHAILLSQSGLVLYCRYPEHIGLPFPDAFGPDPSVLRLTEAMAGGAAGTAVFSFGNESTLAAFSPLEVADARWTVLAVVSEKEALEVTKGFRTKFLIAAGTLFAFCLLGSYLGLRHWRLNALESGRLRAEKKVQEGEAKYRRLFNSVNDAIFVYSIMDQRPGPFLEVNDFACERLGYTREEIITLTPYDLDASAPEGEVAKTVIQQFTLYGRALFETVIRAKDGTLVPVEINAQLFEGSENPTILAAARDISERKRAEVEIRRVQDSLNDIITLMPSLLISVNCDGLVTQWNLEAQRVTGMPAASTTGKPLALALPALDPVFDMIAEAMRKRTPLKEERMPLRLGDEVKLWDIVIYPLASGDSDGAVIRIDDATERVLLEEMMAQSEKMVTVGGLAAGMAHEINNPLGGILQAAQNALRRVSPEHEMNRKAAEKIGVDLVKLMEYLEARGVIRCLEVIRELGERAGRIVANMLSFSRQSGSQMAPALLPDLVDKVIDLAGSDYMLKKSLDFKAIEIVKEYDPSLGSVVCAGTEIEQVLLNLLKNAAQAMTSGARQPRITVRLIREDAMARIEIEDNGPGMDEATKKRIFEPFFTTKEVGLGTGLGLAVSYFIVTRNHGGTITVDSEPGRGTRFTVRLPIRR